MQAPGYFSLVLKIGVPHFLQKYLRAAAVTWYSAKLSLPESTNSFLGITA